MGYTPTRHKTTLEAFQDDYARRTRQNREMLDHLLHNAFPGDGVAEPEVDLIMTPTRRPSASKKCSAATRSPTFRPPTKT